MCGGMVFTNSIMKTYTCASEKTYRARSLGECRIMVILDSMGIDYKTEHTIPNVPGYRFDFYVPKLNLLIEYDGIQHFDHNDYRYKGDNEKFLKSKFRDKAKSVGAIRGKYNLLRIDYLVKDI